MSRPLASGPRRPDRGTGLSVACTADDCMHCPWYGSRIGSHYCRHTCHGGIRTTPDTESGRSFIARSLFGGRS